MTLSENGARLKRCCGPNGCGTVEHPETKELSWKAGTENARRWCVASDCMAWRWSEHATKEHAALGYCGLAGKP